MRPHPFSARPHFPVDVHSSLICPLSGLHGCAGHPHSSPRFSFRSWRSHLQQLHLSPARELGVGASLQLSSDFFLQVARALRRSNLWLCWRGHPGTVWSIRSRCRHCKATFPSPPAFPLVGLSAPPGLPHQLDDGGGGAFSSAPCRGVGPSPNGGVAGHPPLPISFVYPGGCFRGRPSPRPFP